MISDKQKKILAYPYTKYDALICDGAVRSGKTSIMMWAFVDWAMREFSGQRFGICGKTVDSAAKNIIVPFVSMSLAKERYIMRWRRADKVLEVRRGFTTNYFEVFGGKDESSFALIQGRTLGGVLLDEVALMPRSFVEQALARCSLDGARLWFSCNPDSPSHWFYTEWIQRRKERNALYLHFEMQDNPSLSAKTLERYENMYSGVFYQRYVKGLWVAAEGAIYPVFAGDTSKYLVDGETAKGRTQFIQIGLDFGGNKSAHSIVASGLRYDHRWLTALASRRLNAKDVTPDRLYKWAAEFIAFVEKKYGKPVRVYADSAEQTLIAGLRQHIDIPAANSLKRPINDRIRATLGLMARGIFGYTEDCETLKSALCDAVWDEKVLEDERLDNGTSDIDTLDAFEYSFENHLGGYARNG